MKKIVLAVFTSGRIDSLVGPRGINTMIVEFECTESVDLSKCVCFGIQILPGILKQAERYSEGYTDAIISITENNKYLGSSFKRKGQYTRDIDFGLSLIDGWRPLELYKQEYNTYLIPIYKYLVDLRTNEDVLPEFNNLLGGVGE